MKAELRKSDGIVVLIVQYSCLVTPLSRVVRTVAIAGASHEIA